jgi:hypothetical protein
MDENTRSEDIFEHIEGYQKPPLVPLPDAGDLRSLEFMGYKPSAIEITKFSMAVSGFNSFWRQLPEKLEPTLRRSNMRRAGLFSAVHSATLALLDDPRSLSPLERAAALVMGAKDLFDDLWSARLSQDMYKEHPLEMGQYPNLFSTSLVIDGPKARIYKSKNISQLTVLLGGRMYILETGILGKDTGIELLIETLKKIVSESPDETLKTAPGILTSADYGTTVNVFNRLKRNEINRNSLNILRHSFLTLCLDLQDQPESYTESARIAHSTNWENRWHHASFQIVVFGNSKACVLCNFNAYLDGNTMMRSASEIQKRASTQDLVDHPEQKSNHTIQVGELPWEIDKGALLSARQDIERVLDDQQATYEITTFGESSFKKAGLPPVQTFILALLLTTYRLTGNIANIFQMMTMSRYRCMDLASAIVTTAECVEFVDYLENEEISRQRAMDLVRNAIESQIVRAQQARKYMSFDKILALFILSKSGYRRTLVKLWLGLILVILRLFRLISTSSVDIIVSHPSIYAEVPVVGRPGIRLPYTRYFGLHYQIHPEKIVITMMPGLEWDVPNNKLIEELEHNLDRILGLAAAS